MDIRIRTTTDADTAAIAALLNAAFGPDQGPEIAALVADLLHDPSARPLLSLAATREGRMVGYILFTHTQIAGAEPTVSSAILAPMAVHPDHQGQGIGGRLIAAGLEQLKAAGVQLVFVLGHPGYYPRYGFDPAGERGLEAPHPIPGEQAAAWMVQELQPSVIGNVSGRVVCADTLNDPKHWQE
ncbi:N-acetyltransferase [Thiohalobacter sp. COW1]|uniref:N-acetyltransferase GCN5 n=1 Tax=Thiohalobacter thiocyanaticus TaxID=585455 RepID=A0A1Z4VMD8_9GAMM|nr:MULTISPECIES: N-acetyltransferase [Thiohalobacter]BAZ92518.1 N-acetyltransferase GCN5 [Thiohalobacter thiocyanaticus]BCO32499.1 N-acetyltransferase [Thiohalobacter sp. COW1]